MKIKYLSSAVGLGLIWHGDTRTLLLSFFVWTLSLHFPLVGSCKACGHGWVVHVARRDHGAIQWRCLFKRHLGGDSCDCQHYDPISRGAK